MNNLGNYITFEGGEGIGKTTQVKLVHSALREKQIEFLAVREPGGTAVAEKIRAVVLNLDKTAEEIIPKTEALLFAAARAQLFDTLIKPHLNKGGLVISDRGLDSSIAYQAYGRKLGFSKIFQLSQFALDDRLPDLTIFLDMDPVLAFARKGGPDANDRMEQSGLDFHKRIYEGFKNLVVKFPERFVTVNANQTIEDVHNDIKIVMSKRVPQLQGLEF